jgi:hypothetical protein
MVLQAGNLSKSQKALLKRVRRDSPQYHLAEIPKTVT